MLLNAITTATSLLLQPIPPFTWFGLPLSTFDVAATWRLCIVLRQLRELFLKQHEQGKVDTENVEDYSLVKNIATALVVVYGGEAVMGPWLGISPSFMFSPTIPLLYVGLTVVTEKLPWVPSMSMYTEFPLSFFDGLTRAFLLCQLIPPVVTTHVKPEFSSSPWTLLLSSLVIANGGFFFVNLFSMLSPAGYALTTPTELRAYGWTTIDLWCAPVTTGLYAFLTHAQPFWADLHRLLLQTMMPYATENADAVGSPEKLPIAEPLDHESARAICAVFLTTLFVTRTVRIFGPDFIKSLKAEKKKVMRNRVDGRRYPATPKSKTQ